MNSWSPITIVALRGVPSSRSARRNANGSGLRAFGTTGMPSCAPTRATRSLKLLETSTSAKPRARAAATHSATPGASSGR